MHAALLYIYIYLYAALLSVHKQTHVYARPALNHSINMCYASELKKFQSEKIVEGREIFNQQISVQQELYENNFHDEKRRITVCLMSIAVFICTVHVYFLSSAEHRLVLDSSSTMYCILYVGL